MADLVGQLLDGGFDGLICMRSGNVAEQDIAKYKAAGAHCAFGKDVSMKQMIEEVMLQYVRRDRRRRSRGGSSGWAWSQYQGSSSEQYLLYDV